MTKPKQGNLFNLNHPDQPVAFLQPITRADAENLNALLKDSGIPWEWIFARYNVTRAGELTMAQLSNIWSEAGDGRLQKAFEENPSCELKPKSGPS